MKMDLIRDVLDKQLVDEDKTRMGRIDGIVLELRDNQPPIVDHFALGAVVLARRLHPRAEQFVTWIRRHLHVRKEAIQKVQWPLVAEITPHHIKVAFNALESPAFDWERWLSRHIIEKIPGSSK